MRLVVLGSGTAILSAERFGTSFFLEMDGQNILLDCGWGCGINLLRAGLSPLDLDHIVLSHAHGDHMAGLIPILQSLRVMGKEFGHKKREKALYIHGYEGMAQDVETLKRVFMSDREERYPLIFREYGEGKGMMGSISFCTVPACHGGSKFPSISMSLTGEGKKICYSGDTGYNPSLLDVCRGADLAIVEAAIPPGLYWQKGPHKDHLSAYEAGLLGSSAGVQRLLITHIYPFVKTKDVLEEARKNYSGELYVANDLMVLEI